MSTATDARGATDRVEQLLGTIGQAGGVTATTAAEAIVRELLGLHENALTRLLDAIVQTPQGKAVVVEAAGDDTVAAVLALYGLHPVPVGERVHAALAAAAPAVGGREPRLLEVTDDGTVRVGVEGGCGCGGRAAAAESAIRAAVQAAAPEIAEVAIEALPAQPPLLSIGRRPVGAQA